MISTIGDEYEDEDKKMRTSIKIICNECGKEVFGSVHIQNIDRLTHNDYGLYSVEHESCVAIIIHDKIDHVHFHCGNLVCESCYKKLNESNTKIEEVKL